MLSQLSDLLANFEEGTFGLALYLAPDYFFNPEDGFLKPAVRTTQDDNHFDLPTLVATSMFGASILTGFLGRIFLCKTAEQKTLLAKIKMLGGLAKLPLWTYAALGEDPEELFSKQFWAVLSVFEVLSLMIQSRASKNWVEAKSIKMSSDAWACILLVLWGAPFAVSLFLMPEEYEKLHLARDTTKADSFGLFMAQNAGANLTAIGMVLLLEAKNLPKTSLRHIQLLALLMILPIWKASMDSTGYTRPVFHRNTLFIHVTLLAITALWFEAQAESVHHHPPAKGAKEAFDTVITNQKDYKKGENSTVPTLRYELDRVNID